MPMKLGELLVKAKLINPEQLDQALKNQKEEGGKLGEALVRLGIVSEEDITETLSHQFGVPSINLAHFEIDPGVIKLVPGEVARKYMILPVNKTGATLTIAMGDPTNVFAMDDIKFMTGYKVEPVVASEIALRAAIEKHYGSPRSLMLQERAKPMGGGAAKGSSLDEVMSTGLTVDDMAGVSLGDDPEPGKAITVIQAGTGVGKSLAYLVPAILFAVTQRKKAIVSTHTINLQEQLTEKDLPMLAGVLAALPEPVKFNFTMLKGRANYLCTRRLQKAMQQSGNLLQTGPDAIADDQ